MDVDGRVELGVTLYDEARNEGELRPLLYASLNILVERRGDDVGASGDEGGERPGLPVCERAGLVAGALVAGIRHDPDRSDGVKRRNARPPEQTLLLDWEGRPTALRRVGSARTGIRAPRRARPPAAPRTRSRSHNGCP